MNKDINWSGIKAFDGWNNGIIYTADNCSGCNECLNGCPMITANVVSIDKETGKTSINVDANRCITCGHCVAKCRQFARVFQDDTNAFFDDLAAGSKISLIVDTSISIDYPEDFMFILGYLRHLGVNMIYSTAYGADICTWAYLNYMADNNIEGAIASTCPSVISYIERFEPDLIPKLIPVYSPVMCSAVYIRKYIGLKDKLAYIGPCISKKLEIEDPSTHRYISYNVTFKKLMDKIRSRNVDIHDYISYYEKQETLSGSMFSMPGGLKRNIETYIGYSNFILQISGENRVYPFLNEYPDIIKNDPDNLPFLVELLSCPEGCNIGSASEHDKISKYTVEAEMYKVKNDTSQKTSSITGSPAERFTKLNSYFRKLNLNDFIRKFSYDNVVDELYMSEQVMDVIFKSMNKFTEEERSINCGACGYASCEEMALAIGYEINIKENCIFYTQNKMRMENNQIKALISRISDMNEELKESSEMKSNFLANMSHEIRTPMNTVIGMAEMALRGNLADRERDYITQIRSSGRSLLAIINDILDFSKIESGKLEIHEVEYDLMPLIHDVSAMIVNRIQEKPIHLLLDIKPSFPSRLIGDDVRIRQMIINFANNAVKFTQKGMVCLHFDYCECDEGIRFICAVEDTGIGIKEEDLKKLFVSFQQVDSARNRNIEGTGLGLAITKMLAELMDGTVSVSSTYGVGTVFTFDVLQKVADASPSAQITRESAGSCACIIDDSHIDATLTDIITQLGIELKKCTNKSELSSAIDKGADTIFVSFGCYTDDIMELAEDNPDVSFVIITDPRYDVYEPDDDLALELKLPLSCFNVSAAINRTNLIDIHTTSDAVEINFEAPEAKILIVDDNVTNLTVAEGLLEPLKMHITTCSSPTEAIDMVKTIHYDLIFMDHMMPGMDGVEVTHRIRDLDGDYYKNVPIIALTANAVSGMADMFIAEGLNDFVSKPIEMNNIMAVLKKWLPGDLVHELRSGERLIQTKEDIPKIKGLNTAVGVAYTGSTKLYFRVIKDYYKDINDTSQLIELYEQNNDIDNYKILVHSLKSSSRTIGATELSELAASLESAAVNGNTTFIHNNTAKLLKMYRDLIPILEPYTIDEHETENKVLLDDSTLIDLLGHLINAMEDLDFNTSTTIIECLEDYKLPDDEVDIFDKVRDCVEELDSENLENYVMEWMDIRKK